MTEPTDGEAADPWIFKGSTADTPTVNLLLSDPRASLANWLFQPPSERIGANVYTMLLRIAYGPNDTNESGWHWAWSPKRREFMPDITLLPRVAAVEQFVGRQRDHVSEVWRRVNSAVDVLRYGDTGDW